MTMTTAQMKYFIETANCLSFTEAAERLYISQPSLSRHISSIEAEMSVQLFLRSKNRVNLTPAGKELLDGFKKIYSEYQDLVDRVFRISADSRSALNVGLLEDILLPDTIKKVLALYSIHNPNMDINLTNHSFKALTDGLYNGYLDLIITLANDLDEKSGIEYRTIETWPLCLIVQSKHKIAALDKINLEDFGKLLKDENFIIMSPDESKGSAYAAVDDCKRAHFTPKFKYAQTASLLSLWVAAGQGVSIVNIRHTLINNPDIRFIPVEGLRKSEFVIAWAKPVTNTEVSLFIERISEVI